MTPRFYKIKFNQEKRTNYYIFETLKYDYENNNEKISAYGISNKIKEFDFFQKISNN